MTSLQDGNMTMVAPADSRSTRRGERRKIVREALLDSVFDAVDKLGPTVSMDDIAREAGVAKPKLYRYFEDKADLHTAVIERVQEMVWTAAMGRISLMTDSATVLVNHGAEEYARVVAEHPNVLRFIVQGHSVNTPDGTERLINAARAMTRDLAEMLSNAIDADAVSADEADLAVGSAAGAIGTATDWFLGANQLRGNPMPIERFTEYLATLMLGIAESIAKFNGLTVDPELPLHLAFTNNPR